MKCNYITKNPPPPPTPQDQAGGITWMADFSTPATASDTTENQADAPQDPFAGQGDGQGWPPADGWGSEVVPAATEEEVRSWSPDPTPEAESCATGGGETGANQGAGHAQNMPGIIFTNEFGQEIEDTTEGSQQGLNMPQDEADDGAKGCTVNGSTSEGEPAEEWGERQYQSQGSGQMQPEGSEGFMQDDGGGAVPSQAGWVEEGQADASQGQEGQAGDSCDFRQPAELPERAGLSQGDPVGQHGGDSEPTSTEVLDFELDPFVETTKEDGIEWAGDPFNSEEKQMWSDNWGAKAAEESWGPAGTEEGPANGGSTSTDAHGDPAGTEAGEDGFAAPDGTRDGERGEGPPASTDLPVMSGSPQSPGNGSVGNVSNPKETENNNSDLSEDEVANRRYGELYQEVEAQKAEEVFSGRPSPHVA